MLHEALATPGRFDEGSVDVPLAAQKEESIKDGEAGFIELHSGMGYFGQIGLDPRYPYRRGDEYCYREYPDEFYRGIHGHNLVETHVGTAERTIYMLRQSGRCRFELSKMILQTPTPHYRLIILRLSDILKKNCTMR